MDVCALPLDTSRLSSRNGAGDRQVGSLEGRLGSNGRGTYLTPLRGRGGEEKTDARPWAVYNLNANNRLSRTAASCPRHSYRLGDPFPSSLGTLGKARDDGSMQVWSDKSFLGCIGAWRSKKDGLGSINSRRPLAGTSNNSVPISRCVRMTSSHTFSLLYISPPCICLRERKKVGLLKNPLDEPDVDDIARAAPVGGRIYPLG